MQTSKEDEEAEVYANFIELYRKARDKRRRMRKRKHSFS